MPASPQSLRIGPVLLPSRAFLAPMSGVTDLPFRRIAVRFGAGMVVSEMVAGEAAARGSEEARLRAEGEGLAVHVVQLAGSSVEDMVEGVKVAEAAGADIIDINMGCPSKRVISGYSGSALMRDLDHAQSLIDATIDTASVPITLKMRLGWDEHSLNAPELAMRAEAAGVSMVTVHGRTRCQFYKGSADWSKIREVCRAVSIPVVANGDLTASDQPNAMLEASEADAVMIGRGAYGQPWFVGEIAAKLNGQTTRPSPIGQEMLDLVLEHYQEMLHFYGVRKGVRVARKHLGWYLDRLGVGKTCPRRFAVMTGDEPNSVMAALRSFDWVVEHRAAA